MYPKIKICSKVTIHKEPLPTMCYLFELGPMGLGSSFTYVFIYIYMYACMYIYIYIVAPPTKKTYLFESKLVVHFKDTWTKSTSLSTCFSGERRPTKITKGRSGRPLLHNSRLRLSRLGCDFGFLVILKISLGCK